MSRSSVQKVLDRLPSSGSRRASLSVAAYRTAFETDRDAGN